MIIKLINLINYLGFLLIDLLLKGSKNVNPKSLLLIRLDAIGDYVLFRNFIKILKESSKYKNYKITLCGNMLWKEIAGSLDVDAVDNFIWIDRKKFFNSLSYKYKTLKRIRNYGFEVAIETTFSREILYGDEIIKVSRAKERIGSKGSEDKHSKWKRNLISDKWYSKLISLKEGTHFEFFRNKEFLNSLIDEEIIIKKPFIDVNKINFSSLINKPYITVFHGAAREKKVWDYKNFVEIAKYLIKKYSVNIGLVGGKNEVNNALRISKLLSENNVRNLTGETSLTELVKIISDSKLLISNDSAAIHIAVSVDKQFICISNGERYGRFLPYPKEVFDKGYYVYPDEIKNSNKSFEELSELYRFDSGLDINSISAEEVMKLCDKILSSN